MLEKIKQEICYKRRATYILLEPKTLKCLGYMHTDIDAGLCYMDEMCLTCKHLKRKEIKMEEKNVLEELGVSIYKRDGKWYWMIKSNAFDKPEHALKDAMITFNANQPTTK